MAGWPTGVVVAFGGFDAPSAGMGSTTHSSWQHARAASVDPQVGLLDVDDAAERLGVTVRFVRRLVAERRIPYVKVGKFVRFDPVEVERWIDEHRVGQLELW
jgi:excisionase family DNA binding protein